AQTVELEPSLRELHAGDVEAGLGGPRGALLAGCLVVLLRPGEQPVVLQGEEVAEGRADRVADAAPVGGDRREDDRVRRSLNLAREVVDGLARSAPSARGRQERRAREVVEALHG